MLVNFYVGAIMTGNTWVAERWCMSQSSVTICLKESGAFKTRLRRFRRDALCNTTQYNENTIARTVVDYFSRI